MADLISQKFHLLLGVSKLRPQTSKTQTSKLQTSKLQTPWTMIEIVNAVLHEWIFFYDYYRD